MLSQYAYAIHNARFWWGFGLMLASILGAMYFEGQLRTADNENRLGAAWFWGLLMLSCVIAVLVSFFNLLGIMTYG